MQFSLANKSCSAIYKSFCDQKLTFQIIHGVEKLTDPKLLLVLDSSFNPPHSAHQNLVDRAVRHYKNQSFHVLLLLSVNNADKAPKPATFDKRMEMMCLMADNLQTKNISTSVGITTSAKFVDKDRIIREHFSSRGLISYLVGFDTIVRILDPKYYLPQSLSEALKEFMASTNFFCLTRNSGPELDKQMRYCSDISQGLYEPTIPRKWGNKIQLEVNDEKYASVCSSNIREAVLNDCTTEDLQDQLPPSILEYIMRQGKNPFV
ncbi:hypothetical protein ZYGR_0W00790 [Zygosaccharomyces rouxii]|uniref:ZYRO0F17996p n=2 Tax=Zygosaccharomyces rouxii TaxID=4956 RepID=C5DZ40_ZYGRC|nr:uncharacterized protein ZYRO0F17996g [Zygosaccharomyces rouxii]KAH9201238.1 hypothetical protein LQ764DRAFT_76762 [Zygosaccharomyces rouxii]GAV50553.1 hypothetical protein ZYGR_0W00790 [Zygosaccharomyces rouxii]CAQ43323.1 Uncharacterized protein YCL047C [Zygosaccharomyces rouxii]CAR29051.1 ZYRO0F17996p [Zygosaccharomyces rouxii]